MKSKGFTLTELLVSIIVGIITLMAITSLFMVGNSNVKKVKPVSETIEEAQSGLATLDFIMSRWGVGVPCKNCNVNTPLPDCPDYNSFSPDVTKLSTNNPYPDNPLCMTVKTTNNNSEVQFFASLGGSGFVLSIDENNKVANLLSCRLSSNQKDNCYFKYNGGFSGFIQLVNLNPNNADCINKTDLNNPNATASLNSMFSSGDFIVRVPHFIRIYVDTDGWLKMDKKDVSICNDSENAVNIAKVRSFTAEKSGLGVKFTIEFQSQTDPTKVFKVEKYYSR
ncbi:prepilin-type N-terminal cleavage/methylation domain-containing protein [Sulfurihydrogenibium sp.]|uniref:PilW family protein n=1 Tax=Sulfurihydrogenibium sp. TaxID=2053621 RepID=UPI0026020F92|nr:prepilin-type N-terminal cleavage/methylation domain-containing protein [Sulfurihydrogenibium sp.]